jgi:hypothetical protein
VAENPFDLGEIIKDPKYDVRIESNEEASARRTESAKDAEHKRIVHLIVLIFALAMVALIFLVCLWEFSPGRRTTRNGLERSWAPSVPHFLHT